MHENEGLQKLRTNINSLKINFIIPQCIKIYILKLSKIFTYKLTLANNQIYKITNKGTWNVNGTECFIFIKLGVI